MKAQKISLAGKIAAALIAVMLLGGALVMLLSLDELGSERVGPGRVWSEEHQHWH